jgi:hypothetical protein
MLGRADVADREHGIPLGIDEAQVDAALRRHLRGSLELTAVSYFSSLGM